jgi:Protein of unknown function (DUF3237)
MLNKIPIAKDSAWLGGRTVLNDWSLLYLFSWDVELRLDRDNLGAIPSGTRINIFARPELSSVYNVGREPTIAGVGDGAISGRLVWGGDELLLRNDDGAVGDIRVTVETDDSALIHVWYQAVGFLGQGGARRLVEKKRRDRIGSEDEPSVSPIIASPRFQTAHPRYRWLNALQGVGFAAVEIVNSNFRRSTADIYAIT